MSIYTKLGFEITIKDINDNPPRFERDLYEIKVAEDESQGKKKYKEWVVTHTVLLSTLFYL